MKKYFFTFVLLLIISSIKSGNREGPLLKRDDTKKSNLQLIKHHMNNNGNLYAALACFSTGVLIFINNPQCPSYNEYMGGSICLNAGIGFVINDSFYPKAKGLQNLIPSSISSALSFAVCHLTYDHLSSLANCNS